MFASFLTQGYYMYIICPDVIFQTLLLCSKLMTSHNVTCHVTSISCASPLSERKRKGKENLYKIRKNKRKENKNC